MAATAKKPEKGKAGASAKGGKKAGK